MATIKLLKIIPSKRKDKKYVAYFKIGDDREKVMHFGSKGMRDFTLISNKDSKFYIKMSFESHDEHSSLISGCDHQYCAFTFESEI